MFSGGPGPPIIKLGGLGPLGPCSYSPAIAEAVTTNFEIDSYHLAASNAVTGNVRQPQNGPPFIDAIQSKHNVVMDMIQQLMVHMDKLKTA